MLYCCQFQRYTRDQAVIKRGERADSVYIIKKGEFELLSQIDQIKKKKIDSTQFVLKDHQIRIPKFVKKMKSPKQQFLSFDKNYNKVSQRFQVRHFYLSLIDYDYGKGKNLWRRGSFEKNPI